VDRHERTEGAETDLDRLPPDTGYRARARLGQTGVRRVQFAIVAIVTVIGAGIAFSIGGFGEAGPSASPGSAEGTTSPSASRPAPTPTALPALAILGSPPPTRPVPLSAGAGGLRWLDPVTGALIGDARPGDRGPKLTFVDSVGRAVQVCTSATVDGSSLMTDVELCTFDERGTAVGRDRIVTLTSELFADVSLDYSGLEAVQLDATVSRDGRWLWLVSAVRGPATWAVDLWRIDLRTRTLDGSREVRAIPIGTPGVDAPSADGWLVDATTVIWPVVRASPNGSQLSVSLTAYSLGESETSSFQQERLMLDSALGPTSPITAAFPHGEARDLVLDPSRAAWATERHYLSISRYHGDDDDFQPFVRIENPDDMTRDVAVGPVIRAEDGMIRDSSWLLDAGRGILYRWIPASRTLTRLDVATRAGTTVILDPEPGPGAADWPAKGADDGLMAWSHLAPARDGGPGPQLAGSADGRVLYALGFLDWPQIEAGPPPRSMVWVLDAESLSVIEAWDPPGPVDEIALGPGGRPLLQISWVTSGIFDVMTTGLWFVDQNTGRPLEVVGQLGSLGGGRAWLIQPSVQTLAGF
jgi:hypothetical protein